MYCKMAARKPVVFLGSAAKAGQRVPIRVKRMITAEEDEEKIKIKFSRILDMETARSLPYRRRKFEWKPPLHWGQVKLFASELEFLTKYCDRAEKVIYVGSSSGQHIPYLAHLFPHHSFECWDPAPMYIGYKDMPNIEFKQKMFTDKVAASIAKQGKPVLFISDIRSMPEGYDYGNMTPELDQELEEDVKKDMTMQMEWCKIIRPEVAMLKFRLPYTPGTTEYLSGDIYFQAYATETSSESRLVIDSTEHPYSSAALRTYDHEKYENFLYRFNRCTRVQPDDSEENAYIRDLFGESPFSYDSWALISIVREYMNKFDIRPTTEQKPGEIIYHLLRYLGTDFDKGYTHKKKIHEDHMEANKDNNN
jgi:hypothetical protein